MNAFIVGIVQPPSWPVATRPPHARQASPIRAITYVLFADDNPRTCDEGTA